MGEDDLAAAFAEGAGGLDVLLAVDQQGGTPQLPGDDGDGAHRDGQGSLPHAGAKGHGHADGQHHTGDGHDDVHEAHEHIVHYLAEKAAQRANDHSGHDTDGHGDKGYHQGVPAAH